SCCDHDDGDRREFPHPLAHLKPIHPGQHDIQEHQVRSIAFNRFQGLRPVAYSEHLVALGLQVVRDDLEQLHIIIDHPDGGLTRRHALPSFHVSSKWYAAVLSVAGHGTYCLSPPCSLPRLLPHAIRRCACTWPGLSQARSPPAHAAWRRRTSG